MNIDNELNCVDLEKTRSTFPTAPVPAPSGLDWIAPNKPAPKYSYSTTTAPFKETNVHARWENITSAKNTIKCSNCGHIRELKHFNEIIKRPVFCEMCGAKMYESEETK